MNILEKIYEIEFTKINFLERKQSITDKKTIIIGPPKSGKSYLIYDYLSTLKPSDYLYIDLDDYKNNIDEIVKNLDSFIIQNNINTLVLENFSFSIDLPKVTNLIITTTQNKIYDDFSLLYLDPLDFEEYLLFDSKHQNISNCFNSFLKYGNFPEMIEFTENKKTKRNYEICQLYCDDKTEFEILFLLIKSSGEKKSINQLYTQLKKNMKISKDKFYNVCESFKSNRLVFFCEKYAQPKSVKKIFIFNHALLDLVSYNKNFNNLFKNMVFLELNKKYKNIYYLDTIDFYIPQENLLILTIPFFNSMIIGNITSKLLNTIDKYDIKNIYIITVSGEQSISFGTIEASVTTFYNWVLSE